MTEQGKVSRCTNIQVLKLFVIKITGKLYLFTPTFPGGLQDVDTPYYVHCCWKLLVPFGHLKQLLSQVRVIIYLNVVSQCLFLFQEEKHSLGIPSGWSGALRWRRIAWLEAEPNGGCSLERCGTSEGWTEQHSLSQRFVLSFVSFGTNVVSWICVCVPFIVNWKLLVRTCPFQVFRTVIAPSSANNYPWPGTCKCWRKVKCIESISELKSDNKEHKAKKTGVYSMP